MNVLKNIIREVRFDVQHFEQSTANNLQNRIISDFNGKISRILDKKLEEFADLRIIKAKRIELDLGELSVEDVETNLSMIIEEKFFDYLNGLNRKIETNTLPEGIEYIHYNDLVFDYLYHYFRYGIVPWNLQEFGESNDLIYWIKYLAEADQKMIFRLFPYFSNDVSARRLISLTKTNDSRELFRLIFPKHIYGLLRTVQQIIENVISNTRGIRTYLNEGILNYFLFQTGLTLYNQQRSDITSGQIAQEFFYFISTLSAIESSSIFTGIITISVEEFPPSSGEQEFIETLKDLYLSRVQQVYRFQFEAADKTQIDQLSEKYFENYLSIHFKERMGFIQDLSESLISLYRGIFVGEQVQKIADIIRGIILDSLISIQLPADSGIWLKQLLNKITISFGQSTHSEVAKLLEEKLILIEDVEMDKKPIEQISLKTLTIDDGGKRYVMEIQQVVRIIDLMAKYGVVILENIFTMPVESFEQIVIWMKKEHTRFFNRAINVFRKEVSPLNLWRMNEFLSSKTLEVINPGQYIHSTLGKVLLLEGIQTGLIAARELQRIGVRAATEKVSKYVKDEKPDLESVLIQKKSEISTSLLQYLKTLMDEEAYTMLIDILKEQKVAIDEKLPDFEELSGIGFNLALSYLFDNRLTNDQIGALKIKLEKEIEQRSSDFAMYLLSLDSEKLKKLKGILSGAHQSRVEQLITSFKYKYKPFAEDEKIETQVEEEKEKFRRIREGEVMYIKNAGLVIINPYITALFSRLKLTEKKKFIDDTKKVKAMQLLQYIVNKNDTPEEHEMILNKILVGMDPSEVIDELQEITEEDKELCDGLLDAVISHWSALKSTSRDNLRASFFMRSGKLVFEESNWRLKVEEKSIDVLIDKMPWSCSMIKLPWMEFPLMTDWR